MTKVLNFPYDHYVDEDHKEVWVHIPGGWPTAIGLPYIIEKHFPGYKGNLCTANFLTSLRENEQKESS